MYRGDEVVHDLGAQGAQQIFDLARARPAPAVAGGGG